MARQGSDHALVQLICDTEVTEIVKPFIHQNWIADFSGDPFLVLNAKLTKTKKALALWNRECFGNIFIQRATLEDIVKAKETALEIYPTAENRTELKKVEVELIKSLKIEEEYWKKKAGMKWFTPGDRNTKFFHVYVQGERRKLHIHEILLDGGVALNTDKEIGEAAVQYYQHQFQEDRNNQNFAMLKHIPRLLTKEDNTKMEKLPDKEEVKSAVFELNGSSIASPDGFTGMIFQKYWEIVIEDRTLAVKAFFYGSKIPRFVSHTNLVLIPKKECPKSFTNLRPISLSSFINKLISRVLHGRMVEFLPKLISLNQLGFVKARSIIENVLLAQEIIIDINKRKAHVNIVVKLNMAKAYDRVFWLFLAKVPRSFGFSEVIIDMV